jgi:hypothetical protein
MFNKYMLLHSVPEVDSSDPSGPDAAAFSASSINLHLGVGETVPVLFLQYHADPRPIVSFTYEERRRAATIATKKRKHLGV